VNHYLVQKSASFKIDEIYRYTLNQWGKKQAFEYISGLFDSFSKIEECKVSSKSIPSEFAINGFYFQYQKHFVYWKYLSKGEIGIVTVLHQKMHQIRQFKETF
jgi:toxin ParE1/3/4